MLVDWSGSMYDAIRETYEQSIVLAMFCRRVGIPHRVFAFTDAWRGYTEAERENYRTTSGFQIKPGFKLLELFTDKMNKKDFFEAAVSMNANLESMCGGRYYYSSGNKGDRFEADYGQDYNYSLGGTPLDESLMVIRDYIADFKHNYGIDKLQFVTLTDGQSFQLGCFPYSDDKLFHDRRTKNTFAYTKKGSRRGTDNLLKWIETTTGVDTVGFFICPNKHRDFDSAVDMFSGEYQDWDTKQDGYKVFRKEGGYSVPTTEKSGYKEFYILNKKKMGIVSEDDTLDVQAGATKQALKGAMKRMGNNKMSQRKILQHFVKKVA